MGARRLKQLAVDWVQSNKTTGPLVAEMDAMRQKMETLTQQIEGLMAANRALQQEVVDARRASVGQQFPVGMPSPEERLSAIKDNSNSDETDALNDVLGER